jgi:hypothetical protein
MSGAEGDDVTGGLRILEELGVVTVTPAVMSRAAFEALSAKERMAHIKSGRTIKD